MQIPGLFIRGLLTGGLGPSSRTGQTEAAQTGQTAENESPSTLLTGLLTGDEGRLSVARRILESYDVTHITPRQFSEMLEKMRDAGLITDAEFNELAKIRTDLSEAGVEPDEAVDLLSFYQQRLRRLELWGEENPDGTLPTLRTAWEKRLQWLEKVATARQNATASLPPTSPAINLDEIV
ncbi:hypothetical protein THTE_4292 [Thermogutta terrifontis]|uniref:Uncharacterized protein n=1 Tax=Thermogutta terrifontis TaxID=1331910 RepID=A0A286RLN6_9BACT|nr:hypothetical protein [Thermogutta terrifontis]ASV76893.1 hypothetical protein THTE_4292 [Thermogutta terrifontis]